MLGASEFVVMSVASHLLLVAFGTLSLAVYKKKRTEGLHKRAAGRTTDGTIYLFSFLASIGVWGFTVYRHGPFSVRC